SLWPRLRPLVQEGDVSSLRVEDSSTTRRHLSVRLPPTQRTYLTQKTFTRAKTSQRKLQQRGLLPDSRHRHHLRLSRSWFQSANNEHYFPNTRPSASADRRVFSFQAL